MADELLSVESSGLVAIANAIRTKGSTNAPLTFPAGFVSALQAITTEATVTPKITPQQKVLTPSDTSFALQAGFHDGSGTVSIQTETGSANPTSSQQTYYPSTGKFFSSFYVGGLGAGYQVKIGTKAGDGGYTFTVNQLPFKTAAGIVIGIYNTGASKSTVTHVQIMDIPYTSMCGSYATASSYLLIGFDNNSNNRQRAVSNADYSITVNLSAYSTKENFSGNYFYIVWGN